MWISILLAIILGYFIYQQGKRLRALEEVRGPGYVHRFNINAIDAIMKHKMFGHITGIKSASEGKEFKDWTKADIDK
ncbi:MAG: hypothetical protein AAB893_02075 [Patescibacteria group bacterium]